MRRRALLIGLGACGSVLWGCGKPPQPTPTPAPAAPSPVLPGWQPLELMKAAKRVGAGVSPAEGSYFWHSSTEVLLVLPTGSHGAFRIASLDTTTGKTQPHTNLDQRLRGRLRGARLRIASPDRPEGEIGYLPPSVSVSPDGKWLLWYGGLQWTAITLDGNEEFHWRQPSPLQNPAAWLRDGRHWAELEADAREGREYLRRVFVHDLQNPLVDRTIETPALEAGSVLGFAPDGRLLIRHPNPVSPSHEVRFTGVDLASETGGLHPYLVHLPNPGQVVETELSPDGALLAWVILDHTGNQPHHKLWISRSSGDELTLAGTLPNPANPPVTAAHGTPQEKPFLIRWVPDGKALSFIAGDGLYRLSLVE